MLGLGSNLNELKQRIQKAQDELNRLGSPDPQLPEMINSTNLLRINEYLTKSDETKTSLILAYEEYTKKLEELVSSLLDIQADLKDIVKTAANIIAKSDRRKPKKSTKTKRKTRK